MLIDSYGLIIEQGGSGGDSSHYSGLYVIATGSKEINLDKLVLPSGYAVRHPNDGLVDWHSNPNNFSRDQLMPLVAGLYVQGRQDLIKKLAKQHARRAFFAQNIDRDWPNTPKKPYPHYYVDLNGKTQFSWFNYRDPLLPHHIQALLKGAGYRFHFLLYPISLLTYVLEGLSLKFSSNYDIGTYFATGYVLGFGKVFKTLLTDWRYRFNKFLLGWRQGKIIYDPLIETIEKL
jgi:hypothetical protein